MDTMTKLVLETATYYTSAAGNVGVGFYSEALFDHLGNEVEPDETWTVLNQPAPLSSLCAEAAASYVEEEARLVAEAEGATLFGWQPTPRSALVTLFTGAR